MAIVTAPSIADLRDICEFATAHASVHPDLARLHAMREWLEALENLDDRSKVRLAVDSAEAAMPNFEAMLTISIAHVSEATAIMLAGEGVPVTRYAHGAEGWQVYVPRDDEAWETVAAQSNNGEIPTDLYECMAYARLRGCYWLLLDADASEIEELPTYDW